MLQTRASRTLRASRLRHAQISRENSESEIFSRFREKITEPRKFLGLDALGGGFQPRVCAVCHLPEGPGSHLHCGISETPPHCSRSHWSRFEHVCQTQSIQSTNIFESHKKVIFLRNLRMSETRRFERPRSSRSQHSNPGGASCLFKASLCINATEKKLNLRAN